MGEGCCVGLGEAREGEGAWDEFAGGRIGGGRGLVRVEGATVVAGRAEVITFEWN